jgi:hypothetical protein
MSSCRFCRKMGMSTWEELSYKLRKLKGKFFNKATDYSLFGVSILSLFFLILLVVLTFKEEKLYGYSIDISKEGVETFVTAFTWCQDYLKACFLIFPIYVALSTYRIHEANHFRNNILKPQIEKLNSNLITIKDGDTNIKNKRMFKQITSLGGQIIEDIIRTESKGTIQSKKSLQFYFNKYVQQYISIFEECGYWCHNCNGIAVCSGEKCRKNSTVPYNNTKLSHSLPSFQQIARELFCISPSYSDFETDIEEMYKESINGLKQSPLTDI